jgi:hypothetical protein
MGSNNLSPEPEYALLLDAVAPLDSPRTDHRSWDAGLWGRLLDIADWHRLSPLLHTHLNAVGGAPAPVASALERAYLANAARGMFIRDGTAHVLGALQQAGIASVLLKGAALVETVYPDPAQREMLDIDVLVGAEALERATAAVMALGYTPAAELDDTGAADGASATTSPRAPSGSAASAPPHHDSGLVGPDRLVAVELHRHIATPEEGGAFDLTGLWERARTVPDTGHRVPSPEDLLVHVCFHFTRNRLGGSANRRNTGGALAQILDMQRLVAGESVDWDALTRAARDFGLSTRVFLGLFVAAELGVSIPLEAVEQLRPKGFDAELGRRLVMLRVLRAGDHMPVRSMRWMFAPNREALRRGWNADPNATLSLARAYMRRAKAHVPEVRSAVRRPSVYLQDRRLNGQIQALRERA